MSDNQLDATIESLLEAVADISGYIFNDHRQYDYHQEIDAMHAFAHILDVLGKYRHAEREEQRRQEQRGGAGF